MKASAILAEGAASAPAIIPAPAGELFTRARADALDRASLEILTLAQAIQSVRKAGSGVDMPDVFLDLVIPRIALLGSCVGVLADCRIDADEVGAQYRLVFGRGLEVSHA